MKENLMPDLAMFLTVKEASRSILHDLRFNIVKRLYEKGPQSVTELMISLREEQSVISSHLKTLRASNWVHSQKSGKQRIYSIDQSHIKKMIEWAEKMPMPKED